MPHFETYRDYLADEFRELSEKAGEGATSQDRAGRLCLLLEGRPYMSDPLGGGPGEEERLTVRLKSFDCVTFLETVTALSATRDDPSFTCLLRRLRYSGGRVEHAARLHYMTHWFSSNEAEGFVSPPGGFPPPREWGRCLRALPFFGGVPARVRGYEKRRAMALAKLLRTGDTLGFVTARRDLDYFHTGVVASAGEEPKLAHASSSRGAVCVVPLLEFLRRNRMSGVTVMRPTFSSEPFSEP